MKLLLAAEFVELCKREEIMTIFAVLLLWFTDYITAAQVPAFREEDFMYDCIFTLAPEDSSHV